MDQEMVNRLARLIESGLSQGGQRPTPPLRLVGATPPSRIMDSITRESHLRLIRHHKRFYGLQILVDQACMGCGGVDDLSDEAILQLHKDLDRARECIADGISLEDAGLIRACA